MKELSDEEINELVHTKIFNLCWHDAETSGKNFGKCVKCGKACSSVHPYYANSIADAFKVVGKMEKDGWAWEMKGGQAGKHHLYSFSAKRWREPKWQDVYKQDESLPKAICLAAIAALGEQL